MLFGRVLKGVCPKEQREAISKDFARLRVFSSELQLLRVISKESAFGSIVSIQAAAEFA